MSTFTINYPNAYLFLCLIIGLTYSILLYYRTDKFKDHLPIYTYLLAFLRLSVVSILCFLLLEPIVRIFNEKKEDPIIAVFQDVSSSITESNQISQNDYANKINTICDILSTDYEVDRFNFGTNIENGISDSCTDKSTNISGVFSFAEEHYANQNLGAIILISDGINNMGRNPLYEQLNLRTPVYTVAIGDTTLQRDAVIKQVFHNKIAYLGDKQTIQVDIQAYNCAGQNTKVELYHKLDLGYKQLAAKPILIDNSSFFQTIEFELNHNSPGNDTYLIQVNPVGNELSTLNNKRQIFIDVIDGKQNILILANAPHPDLAGLKRIFDTQRNFKVNLQYGRDPSININDFDLIILHNLPSNDFPMTTVLNNCIQENKPTLFMVGAQTNLSVFNNYQDVMKIVGSNRSLNEVQAIVEEDFSLFLLDAGIENKIQNFPPAFAPFGTYDLNKGAQVLLQQKIGNISTEYPLLAYNSVGRKTAVFSAEGIWKWRLFDQLQNGNTNISDQVILKSVQYLTLKEDKRKFRVSSSSKLYPETESINLIAELYNNVYERINDPDVFLKLVNEAGEQFNYTFSKNDRAYELSLGLLPSGEYSYTASTIFTGRQYSDKGSFTIQDIQLESYNLQANHSLLIGISSKFNGQFIEFDSLERLTTLLTVDQQLKPVIYQNASTMPLSHMKWIFWSLLTLLSAEWFIRRFLGNY